MNAIAQRQEKNLATLEKSVLFPVDRATRWVCEKIAQLIFMQKKCTTFTVEKIHTWGAAVAQQLSGQMRK
jgi:hypothetical protein